MTTKPTLIFHLSDIHFGLEDRRALDWVAQEIATRRPDAVMITGDLTMRARHREFAAAQKWISTLEVPVTVEVGNHDMPYYNLIERFVTPYKRFRGLKAMLEREIDLPGLSIVSLKTTARAQWRTNWSKGVVSDNALAKTLAAIDAQPPGEMVLVAAHHPLVEADTHGTALTRGGTRALEELARRKVAAVFTGHVHDAFDIVRETAAGPIRMIGAGTLSQRLRSTPASFNELTIADGKICVEVRNLQALSTPAMMISEIPENAKPPRTAGEPVAPANQVPAVDPPVH